MTKRKPKSEHKPDGRPTVMTQDVLAKLEDAFMNAFTDEMACLYAGISEASLYRYCEENPDFRERKETLKQSPHLLAQKELVEGIKGNLNQARWWAEHRMPDFMPKSKVEHTGLIRTENTHTNTRMKQIGKKYEEELRQEIIAQRREKAKQPKP